MPLETGELVTAAKCNVDIPSHVGRYRVRSLLDAGGFGQVYLVFDEQLAANLLGGLRLLLRA
jgi:hypothetical protein